MKLAISVTSQPYENERFSRIDSWVGAANHLYPTHTLGFVLGTLLCGLTKVAAVNNLTYTVEILEP